MMEGRFGKGAASSTGIEATLRPESVTPRQLDVNRIADMFEFKTDEEAGKLLVRFKDFVEFYGNDPFPE